MVNIKKKFTRRGTRRHSKLGRGRKNKQKWRKPKGRDNKMRENKKSRPPVVSVGYRKPKEERGKINGKKPVRVENLKDARNVGKGDLVIIASVGKKKRLEIEKIIGDKGADILNDRKSIEEDREKFKSRIEKEKSKKGKESGKGKKSKKSKGKKKPKKGKNKGEKKK